MTQCHDILKRAANCKFYDVKDVCIDLNNDPGYALAPNKEVYANDYCAKKGSVFTAAQKNKIRLANRALYDCHTVLGKPEAASCNKYDPIAVCTALRRIPAFNKTLESGQPTYAGSYCSDPSNEKGLLDAALEMKKVEAEIALARRGGNPVAAAPGVGQVPLPVAVPLASPAGIVAAVMNQAKLGPVHNASGPSAVHQVPPAHPSLIPAAAIAIDPAKARSFVSFCADRDVIRNPSYQKTGSRSDRVSWCEQLPAYLSGDILQTPRTAWEQYVDTATTGVKKSYINPNGVDSYRSYYDALYPTHGNTSTVGPMSPAQVSAQIAAASIATSPRDDFIARCQSRHVFDYPEYQDLGSVNDRKEFCGDMYDMYDSDMRMRYRDYGSYIDAAAKTDYPLFLNKRLSAPVAVVPPSSSGSSPHASHSGTTSYRRGFYPFIEHCANRDIPDYPFYQDNGTLQDRRNWCMNLPYYPELGLQGNEVVTGKPTSKKLKLWSTYVDWAVNGSEKTKKHGEILSYQQFLLNPDVELVSAEHPYSSAQKDRFVRYCQQYDPREFPDFQKSGSDNSRLNWCRSIDQDRMTYDEYTPREALRAMYDAYLSGLIGGGEYTNYLNDFEAYENQTVQEIAMAACRRAAGRREAGPIAAPPWSTAYEDQNACALAMNTALIGSLVAPPPVPVVLRTDVIPTVEEPGDEGCSRFGRLLATCRSGEKNQCKPVCSKYAKGLSTCRDARLVIRGIDGGLVVHPSRRRRFLYESGPMTERDMRCSTAGKKLAGCRGASYEKASCKSAGKILAGCRGTAVYR